VKKTRLVLIFLMLLLQSFAVAAGNANASQVFTDTIVPKPPVDTTTENKVITEVIASKDNLKKDKVDYLANVTKYGFKDLFKNYSYNSSIPYSSQVNPNAETYMQDYLQSHQGYLLQLKKTGATYFNLIDRILSQYGLPRELKYLAVIESKLKTSATSRVGAAGIWQFMPTTGRLLGLRIAGKTDERRYIYKSSVAAAKYLNDLYKLFDDWLLVIAAYNGGPGTVYKAIKKSGSRDFWKLQYFLPQETRLHVKKFIATHYYYEEKGSLVTLTKTEREKHLKTLKEFESIEIANDVEDPQTEPETFFNWILITHDDNNRLKFIAKS